MDFDILSNEREGKCVGNLTQIFNFNSIKITKGDKMYNDFLKDIRQKSKEIKDMPSRAQEVLDYFHINDLSSGVPIVEILIKMGFKNYQSNLEPNGLSAYIAVDPQLKSMYGSDKITCVHIKKSVGHKKFALAHELGHFLFDFNDNENIHYYNTYFPKKDEDDPKEKRANAFAANLLMPKKQFMQKVEEYQNMYHDDEIINALAQYFVVSPTAIVKRFDELDIGNIMKLSTN